MEAEGRALPAWWELCRLPAGSGGLRLHSLPIRGPRRQSQGLVLRLCQRVDHGHVHVAVVSLLEPPATLVTREVQLGFGLVFGHVVLEGCPLPALKPTDFTPGGQGQMSEGTAPAWCQGTRGHLLQRLGSRMAHLVYEKVLPLLEGLSTLVTDVVPHL